MDDAVKIVGAWLVAMVCVAAVAAMAGFACGLAVASFHATSRLFF